MTYVLGSNDPEMKRLEAQAGALEQPTRLLLPLAGIEPGMRVLELGTGLGHMAYALGELTGPTGQVVGIGVQGYIAPDDPRGPAMLAGIVRSLAPQMVAAGIATAADLGVDTLQDRPAAEMQASRAVPMPPTLVGAWDQRR